MILAAENFYGITDAIIPSHFKYAAYANISTAYSRWPSNSSGMQLYSTSFGSAGSYIYLGVTGSNSIYTGFACYALAARGLTTRFRQNGNTHLDAGITDSGLLTIRRNLSTTLATYNIPNYAINTWYYYEFGAYIHATSGSFQFKINGRSVVSQSNINTYAGAGSAWVDEVGHEGESTGGSGAKPFYITDWYITNSSGSVSASNGFLGDIRLYSTIPSSSGDQINFLPSASTNTSQVDDGLSPDGDTTFVSASAPGSMDLYRTAPYTGSATSIYGVVLRTYAKKTDAGTREFVNVLKNNGSYTFSPTQSIGASYVYYTNIIDTNPSTGLPFASVGEVSASQVGFKIVT